MFKPISSARGNGQFKSNDSLAKELRERFPSLKWPAPRALAVKIGEIDRSKTVWWLNRPEQAKALAEHLGLDVADLGLHNEPSSHAFKFKEFPELPPLDLSREPPCELASAIPVKGRDDGDIEQWLGRASRARWVRQVSPGISWIYFPKGSGRDLFWAWITANTPYDCLHALTISEVAQRLKQAKPLAIYVDADGGEKDLFALAARHPDTSVLVVAPFTAPSREEASPAETLMDWNYLIADRMERKHLELTNPHYGIGDAITQYVWTLHADWQEKLLSWVEKRLFAASVDTLFSAGDLRNWLRDFTPLQNSIETPGDLMVLCRMCHNTPKNKLPHLSDPNAIRKLIKLTLPVKPALERQFVQLAEARWQDPTLPWSMPLSHKQWSFFGAPGKQEFLAIAQEKSEETRSHLAEQMAERVCDGSLEVLIEHHLLMENANGGFDLRPKFLVDLIIREQLIKQIKHDPIEGWAKFCFYPDRQPLIDAALNAIATDDLIPVSERLHQLPSIELTAIGASEAMFYTLAKRITLTGLLPEQLHRLAAPVLARLSPENEFFPQPWSRSLKMEKDETEWIAVCWAWSLTQPPAQFNLPALWSWYFPGWAEGLDSKSLNFRPVMLDRPVDNWHAPIPPHWHRLLEAAKQLVEKLEKPIKIAPTVVSPFLLAAGAEGKWAIEQGWWKGVINRRWAEEILLDRIRSIGPRAAKILWPSLIRYSITLNLGQVSEINFDCSLLGYSSIRTWILKNLSGTDALSGLDDIEQRFLCSIAESLPPHVRATLLENTGLDQPDGAKVAARIIPLCEASSMKAITKWLDTDIGNVAAKHLWNTAPLEAERLLTQQSELGRQATRYLIQNCPTNQALLAANAIIKSPAVFSQEERYQWVKTNLPQSKENAKTILAVLALL